MLTAAVLYDRAVDHGNAGRHAAARKLLAAASARSDDPDLSARIDGTLAYIDAETGSPDAAIARCVGALSSAAISPHTRAVLTSQLGLIELRRGDLEAALPHLSEAATALGDDAARLGRVLLNRGLVHLERGDTGRADADFEAAAEAFERVGDAVERAKAQHNRGYAALLRGELVVALDSMGAARDVLAALSPVASAVCDLDRAETLRAAGMPTDAVGLLESAVRVFGARRLRQMQADAELVLAATLLDQDPARAAVVARRAGRRYRSRGNETAALRADACELTASVTCERTDRTTALRIDATAAALRSAGLPIDARSLELQGARLDVREGRPPIGLEAADDTEATSISSTLLAYEVAAEAHAARGAPEQVLRAARDGLHALSRWQSAFGSLDLRASTAMRGRRLALAGIDAALRTEDPAVVFEWAERTRSISARVTPVHPPADSHLASMLTDLRVLRMTGADSGRERSLERAIRERQWSGEGSHTTIEVASLTTVLDVLDRDGATLVSYLWTGDRIVALVADDGVRVVDLGPWKLVRDLLDGLLSDLDAAAAALPASMAAVVRSGLDARLSALDAALVAPLEIQTGRVVITPAGVLSGVPWSMLATLRGRSVTLPVSAGRWLAQTRSPMTVQHAGFAAGPGVDRAPLEVDRSSAVWNGSVVLAGDGATCEAASALASSVDVLHIAAHGRHSVDNPLFSGVELADGTWFGYDVDRIESVPQVVVLSACEVGRSASGWGRESLGMAQSWLHAGARAVLAAPASVADELASALLPQVHAALGSGSAISDALTAASERVGRRAPFQVYGAGW